MTPLTGGASLSHEQYLQSFNPSSSSVLSVHFRTCGFSVKTINRLGEEKSEFLTSLNGGTDKFNNTLKGPLIQCGLTCS